MLYFSPNSNTMPSVNNHHISARQGNISCLSHAAIRFLTSIKQYHGRGTACPGSDNLQGFLIGQRLLSFLDQLGTPRDGIYYFIGATGASATRGGGPLLQKYLMFVKELLSLLDDNKNL